MGPAQSEVGAEAQQTRRPRVHREVVSFVRRSTRMNPSQHRALDELGPRYLLDFPRGQTSTSLAPGARLDRRAVYGRVAPLTVEIGCGSGDVLATVAPHHRERDFLGFEVYLPSVASALHRIDVAGASNARLTVTDAAAGLEHLVGPGELDEVWTFFPDPWHKKRHHKRRIVNPEMAALVASRLRPGGLWRLATDWDDYATWMVEVLSAQPDLEPATQAPTGTRWSERPLTRYESKGIEAGRTIHDLCWRRRES